jgi:hypothetical protein
VAIISTWKKSVNNSLALVALIGVVAGCGGGGPTPSTASTNPPITNVAEASTVANVQALDTAKVVQELLSSIALQQTLRHGKLPIVNYLYSLGYDNMTFMFTSDVLHSDGTIEGSIAIYADARGTDGVGSVALNGVASGSGSSYQALVSFNGAPLPIQGSVTATETGDAVNTLSGTVTDQASGAVIDFSANYANGAYSATDTYGPYTLSAQATLASTGAMSNGKLTAAPADQTGTFYVNSDGSGSMSITTPAQGSFASNWSKTFGLIITPSSGPAISIPAAGDATLN